MMAAEGGHYAAYRLVARSLRKHSPRPPAPPTNYPCVLTVFLNKSAASKVDSYPRLPFLLYCLIVYYLLLYLPCKNKHFKRSIEEVDVMNNCWTLRQKTLLFSYLQRGDNTIVSNWQHTLTLHTISSHALCVLRYWIFYYREGRQCCRPLVVAFLVLFFIDRRNAFINISRRIENWMASETTTLNHISASVYKFGACFICRDEASRLDRLTSLPSEPIRLFLT